MRKPNRSGSKNILKHDSEKKDGLNAITMYFLIFTKILQEINRLFQHKKGTTIPGSTDPNISITVHVHEQGRDFSSLVFGSYRTVFN